MTETPRTDAEIISNAKKHSGEVVCANFARQIERALQETRTALQDCVNLFNDADKSPDHKSLICTTDRREMWAQILNRHNDV